MKAAFFHDSPIVIKDEIHYSRTLGTEVWERYLQNFDELVVSTRIGNFSTDGLRISDHERATFLPITSYHTPLSALFRFKKIIRQIKSVLEKTDCAIIRLPSVVGWLAIAAANSMKKPYIIELVGCPWDAYRFHSYSGKILAPLGFIVTKLAVRNASHVIYVTKDFLQRRYPTIGMSEAISNVKINLNPLVLHERLGKIKELQNSASNPLNRQTIIGSIGKVDIKYKGHKSALLAISELIDEGYQIEYQIVGGGDQSTLRKEIDKLGIENYVRLIGPLKSNEIHEWLDSIDLYLHPSLTEGLPRSAVEALSHGLPAVLSSAGGQPELVSSRFIFKAGNSGALKSILKDTLHETQWKEIAIENFNKSREYTESALQTRRSNILEHFTSTKVQKPGSF